MMEHCNGMMYTVRSGDTLYSVSLKYGVPLALLLRVNPYVDVYNLQPGETICVPVKGSCHDYAAPYQGARSTDPVSGEETSAGRMTMDGMPADRMSGNYSSMDRMPGGETTMDRTSENRSMDRMPAEREPEEDISDRIPMDRMSGGETTMDRTSENRSMDRMPVEREPGKDMPTDRMPMGATMERTSGGRSMDQMPAEREPEEDISDRIPMDRMSGGETTMERTSGSRSMDRMPAEREPEEDMSDRIPMDRMSPGNMAVDDMPMEEMAVRTEWGGPAERGRRCRRYVTKEGDTLEKVLGVESIPLRKGMVICCR